MRPTGVEVIGSVPWSTHFCQFYSTKGDILDILVPYFKAGLEGNEAGMWVTSPPLTIAEAQQALAAAVPDLDSRLAAGQMEFIPYTDWYLQEGSFDLDRVLNGWVARLTLAQGRGYQGLRITGNTAWLELKDWNSFADYEAAITRVIGKHKLLALCTYSLESCTATDVMDVIRNHEFALVRKEGRWEMIENSASRVARQALEESERNLARSNAELEQFAYVASHDLQEPLRMVSSYVQLLRDRYKGKLDQEAEEFIDFAYDGAIRMQQLISDLLSYSRVGTRGKQFDPVSLETALAHALANLSLAISDKGAEVTHGPLPLVSGDVRQLTQLWQNLVENGIKFQGHGPPKVHISAECLGNQYVCSVCDNGIGIEPQYAEKIFLIFHRLHSRAEYPGTGIGLAICKRIVERHGGRIWVESAPGEGSTFRFTLPAPATPSRARTFGQP